MAGALKSQVARRIILGIIGGIVLPAIAIAGAFAPDQRMFVPAVLALPVVLAAELTERFLFFTAVVKPKMPGSY
jgi:formate dehydrogenase iron-sulfur subunit